MARALLNEIQRSAELAATSGRNQPRTAGGLPAAAADPVIGAATLGRAAAEAGVCLPLFVLLDVLTVLRRPASPTGVAQREQGSYTEAYDLWLEAFCALARSRFRSQEYVDAAEALPVTALAGAVQLLAVRCPAKIPDDLNDAPLWVEAYDRLARAPGSQAVVWQAWSEGRRLEPVAWKNWWPEEAGDPSHDGVAGSILGRFASQRADARVHEEFDHPAAYLYTSTEDLSVPPNLAARLKLRRKVLAEETRPRLDAYEVQHPFDGISTLSTLTQGEYGDYKRVNGSDPRIAARPHATPPETLTIHLCWVAGYAALTNHATFGGVNPVGPAAIHTDPHPIQVPYGSILQGLVGLVLDDWRSALSGMRVQFRLHRDFPAARASNLIRPGKRWKQLLSGEWGALPPADCVALLFRRLNHVELSRQPLSWKRPKEETWPLPCWGCGFILREDLSELGFRPAEAVAGETGTLPVTWVGPSDALPRELAQMIVVNAAAFGGGVYRVTHSLDDCCLRLPSDATRPAGSCDPAFPDLREEAFAALLDAVLNTVFA